APHSTPRSPPSCGADGRTGIPRAIRPLLSSLDRRGLRLATEQLRRTGWSCNCYRRFMPLTEQTGPFIQSASLPGVINLVLGQPSPRLLPIAACAAAANRQLHAGTDPLLMQYGAQLGHPGFHVSLAHLLTDQYSHLVTAEELMLTGGNSIGLTLVSEVFARHGD